MRHSEYYTGRAEETRAIAETMRGGARKREMLRVAAQYDRLAEDARTSQRGNGNGSPTDRLRVAQKQWRYAVRHTKTNGETAEET